MKFSMAAIRHWVTLISTGASALGVSGCAVDPSETGAEEVIGEAAEAITYNGHDYLFVMTSTSWAAARSYCLSAGYDLVTIDDSAEGQWIAFQESSRGGDIWWIGLNDTGIEGTWFWADGSPVNYVNWASSQPDSKYSNEDCAVDGWGTMLWNDWGCNNSTRFICEKASLSSNNTDTYTYEKGNTSSATTNTAQRPIQVLSGQVVTVGTCGIFGASVDYGDTWLRVKDPWSQEIASNDDSSGCGWASNISFVASASGTYTINAGCWSSGSCKATVAYKIGQ